MESLTSWEPVVQVGVGHEKGVHVPQGESEVAYHLTDQVYREAPFLPGLTRCVQVPAEGIGTMFDQHVPGVDGVAVRLGHLLALVIQHQSQADDVTIALAIEEQGADGVQRVKPPPGLVDCFADEISRELFLEYLLILKGIVPLGDRHSPRVEPHIDQLGNSAHRPVALGAGELYLIHIRPV